jgi:serine/threonine protein kinase/ankyrin repeat protein
MDTKVGGSIFSVGSMVANRYEVLGLLGSGAVGVVLRVVDHSLDNEECALKVLFPQMSRDLTQFARFRNEVILARRLSHPNISRVYDFGDAGQGYYYISMEYVAGGSLGGRLYGNRSEPLEFKEVLRIIYEIAVGLSAAHEQGIVHRDLKPDNILLTDKGRVKITDFGLARSLEVDKGFTNTGETVGTPYYMAPEQLAGMKPGPSIDIYSLGIIAFELAVGRRPFLSDNYIQLAKMHMRDPIPDFANKETGIPKWFENFVKTCSAKKTENRYPSIQDAAEEISRHMGEESSGYRRLSMLRTFHSTGIRTSKSKKPLVLMAATVVTLVLFFGTLMIGANNSLLQAEMSKVGYQISLGEERELPAVQKMIGSSLAGSDFFSAVVDRDFEKVKFFIEAGRNVSTKDALGNPLILLAVKSLDPKAIRLSLERKGMELEASKLKKGMTLPEKELRARSQRWVKNEVLEERKRGHQIVEALLAAGADASQPGPNEITPLVYAARVGDADLVRTLLRSGNISPYQTDPAGRTAIHIALQHGHDDVVFAVVEHLSDGDLNKTDHKSFTPLMYAVSAENIAVTKAILDKGAGVNVPGKGGWTALMLAVKRGNPKIVELLLLHGADPQIANLEKKNSFDYTSNRKLRQLLEVKRFGRR